MGQARNALQRILDLERADEVAGGAEGVAAPRFEDEAAVAAQPADVAGAEESVRVDRLGARLGIRPVAGEVAGRADLELAAAARRQQRAGVHVAHAYLRRGTGRRIAARLDALGERR